MDDTVDRVMASYENLPALERLGREEIRVKVSQYLEKLSSAGHSDAEELTFLRLSLSAYPARRSRSSLHGLLICPQLGAAPSVPGSKP